MIVSKVSKTPKKLCVCNGLGYYAVGVPPVFKKCACDKAKEPPPARPLRFPGG